MSSSKTITKADDLLDNVHPGMILREDFLIGSAVPLEEVIEGTGLSAERLRALLDAREPIDAAADIRLARYLGMSEGFFLGLQIDYDLEEERRAHGEELDTISRRAA